MNMQIREILALKRNYFIRIEIEITWLKKSITKKIEYTLKQSIWKSTWSTILQRN